MIIKDDEAYSSLRTLRVSSSKINKQIKTILQIYANNKNALTKFREDADRALGCHLSGAIYNLMAHYLKERVKPMRDAEPDQFSGGFEKKDGVTIEIKDGVNMVQNCIGIIFHFLGFDEDFSYTRYERSEDDTHDEDEEDHVYKVRILIDIFGGHDVCQSSYNEVARFKYIDTWNGRDYEVIDDEKTLRFLHPHIQKAVAHISLIRSHITIQDCDYDFTESLSIIDQANVALEPGVAFFCGLVLEVTIDEDGIEDSGIWDTEFNEDGGEE